MIGIQCKTCGRRGLVNTDPPKMGHVVMEELRRSPPACDGCGGTSHHLISLTGGTADDWLKGD